MPVIRCPECRARMEVEAGWIGSAVACPTCKHEFTARNEPSPHNRDREDRDDDRRRGRGDDDDRRGRYADDDRPRGRYRDDDDDRPPRRRYRDYRNDEYPRPKSGNKTVWIVLGVIGVAVVLGCGGIVAGVMVHANRPVQFDGPWTMQSLADGSASASMPPFSVPTTLFTTSGTANVHQFQHDDDIREAIVVLGSLDTDGDSLPGVNRAVSNAIQDDFFDGDATVKGEADTTVDGFPAKETKLESENEGKYVLRVVQLPKQPNGDTRYVIAFAGGKNLSEADRTRFLQSVKVVGR